MKLTAERLREVLDYDPLSGEFRWKISLSNRRSIGDRAGFSRHLGRYTQIRVDGKLYLGHRLAWLYVHGEWPKGEIDHSKNYSNVITNIRIASSSQNKANTKRRSNNKSGFKGVGKRIHLKKPWRARICINGTENFIGYFPSALEAAIAYDAAAREKFGEFALTNKMLGLLK